MPYNPDHSSYLTLSLSRWTYFDDIWSGCQQVYPIYCIELKEKTWIFVFELLLFNNNRYYYLKKKERKD